MKKRWVITEAGRGGIIDLKLFIGTSTEARKYLGQKLGHQKEFWWGDDHNVEASPIEEDADGNLHASLTFRYSGEWCKYFFQAVAEDTMALETYGPAQGEAYE